MLAPQHLRLYADAIHDNGIPLDSCFGFADGKVYQIVRPKINQWQIYHRHQNVCGQKIQNVTLPNDIFGSLVGSHKGWSHKTTMLAESSLLAPLQQHVWFGNCLLSIYGDPAYPLSIHLKAPFEGAHLTDEQKRYNKTMSSVRASVEELFGLVKKYFKFIDFTQIHRIGMTPVGKVMWTFCTLSYLVILSQRLLSVKKIFYRKYCYFEKIYIPVHISYFFVHCLKYENNKKPDKTKLEKFGEHFLFIVPRIYYLNFLRK